MTTSWMFAEPASISPVNLPIVRFLPDREKFDEVVFNIALQQHRAVWSLQLIQFPE